MHLVTGSTLALLGIALFFAHRDNDTFYELEFLQS